MHKFILDENIPHSFKIYLRGLGFSVEHIGDIAIGSSDEYIIRYILNNPCVFVTNDMDFGNLVFQHSLLKHANISIILIRRVSNIHNILPRLTQFITGPQFVLGRFIVIEPDKIRIRALI